MLAAAILLAAASMLLSQPPVGAHSLSSNFVPAFAIAKLLGRS